MILFYTRFPDKSNDLLQVFVRADDIRRVVVRLVQMFFVNLHFIFCPAHRRGMLAYDLKAYLQIVRVGGNILPMHRYNDFLQSEKPESDLHRHHHADPSDSAPVRLRISDLYLPDLRDLPAEIVQSHASHHAPQLLRLLDREGDLVLVLQVFPIPVFLEED